MKKIINYVACLCAMICLIGTTGQKIQALNVEKLLIQYDKVTQNVGYPKGTVTYNENEKYKEYRFKNGYKSSSTHKDITSYKDTLSGIISRIRYSITITTY